MFTEPSLAFNECHLVANPASVLCALPDDFEANDLHYPLIKSRNTEVYSIYTRMGVE